MPFDKIIKIFTVQGEMQHDQVFLYVTQLASVVPDSVFKKIIKGSMGVQTQETK
jgi:hypothetical protein